MAHRPGSTSPSWLVPLLEAIHERLAGVTIERLAWARFIDRYDRPETLFYCDPPYWGSEDDCGKAIWTRDGFARLADCLINGKARWLVVPLRRGPPLRLRSEVRDWRLPSTR